MMSLLLPIATFFPGVAVGLIVALQWRFARNKPSLVT
jgi:hypothetical protein